MNPCFKCDKPILPGQRYRRVRRGRYHRNCKHPTLSTQMSKELILAYRRMAIRNWEDGKGPVEIPADMLVSLCDMALQT